MLAVTIINRAKLTIDNPDRFKNKKLEVYQL